MSVQVDGFVIIQFPGYQSLGTYETPIIEENKVKYLADPC